MKTILVTGASGFIGKNLCSRLELINDIRILRFTKENSPDELQDYISQADFIYHLAGVNRPIDDREFKQGNYELTQLIIDTLRRQNKTTPILISSSTQATQQNPYGESKLAAERALLSWQEESGSMVYIYRLPGIFGKWCRPNYNSVVANFCYNTANGLPITINDPGKIITIAYIDDVIDQFISHINHPQASSEILEIQKTFELSLQELSSRIDELHKTRKTLTIPNLNDLLNKYLYATYTSYLPEDQFSYQLKKNVDQRGWLAEFIKSESFGQIFISKTQPGITRGDHWHATKIEKFLVVQGHGEIKFRDKNDEKNTVITYQVNGNDMQVVDIPVGYVHSISNVGKTELITLFWASEILDKDNPDTFYEKVN